MRLLNKLVSHYLEKIRGRLKKKKKKKKNYKIFKKN